MNFLYLYGRIKLGFVCERHKNVAVELTQINEFVSKYNKYRRVMP